MEDVTWGEPSGQGWTQIWELGLAFVLSVAIGLERDLRNKAAGLRTHTIVGFASALFMLVSKYGFTDVLGSHITLDPSRMAAQIVSGIGFIGGGLIFVRRDAVRGLTTAAAVWLTAAVGCAAGAGLPLLSVVATGCYFLVVFALTPLVARLPASSRGAASLRVDYPAGRGILGKVMERSTELGFVVLAVATERISDEASLRMTVRGPRQAAELAAALTEIAGVRAVSTLDDLGDFP